MFLIRGFVILALFLAFFKSHIIRFKYQWFRDDGSVPRLEVDDYR